MAARNVARLYDERRWSLYSEEANQAPTALQIRSVKAIGA
jgi:hypothetical protein